MICSLCNATISHGPLNLYYPPRFRYTLRLGILSTKCGVRSHFAVSVCFSRHASEQTLKVNTFKLMVVLLLLYPPYKMHDKNDTRPTTTPCRGATTDGAIRTGSQHEIGWLFDSTERISTPRQEPPTVYTVVPQDTYEVVARVRSVDVSVGASSSTLNAARPLSGSTVGCSTCCPSVEWGVQLAS
jgi:hypothetical protein